MEYNKGRLIILIIIIVLVITVVLLVTDTDTGDFKIKYNGNSKKYETSIKSGINRWSSIGTGGISLRFDTYSDGGGIVATTSGSLIRINEPTFISLSSFQKTLAIAHEVGHALGIGVGWPNNRKSQDNVPYLDDGKYSKTAKSYVDNVRPNGQTIPGPPIHNQGEEGSKYVHWSSVAAYGLQKDLMISTISSSATVISIVDLTYLQEIGRSVDLTKAQSLNGTFFSLVASAVMGDTEVKNFCGCCGNVDEHEHH